MVFFTSNVFLLSPAYNLLAFSVQSRIDTTQIFFKAYNVEETVAILTAKICQASPDYNVFDEDAILYASKKTSYLFGDIRKAFTICRAAAEFLLNEHEESEFPSDTASSPIIQVKDIIKVTRDSFNSAQSRCVTFCTPFEILVLVSLASMSKTTGRELGGFDVEELMSKMDAIANASGKSMYLPSPNLPEILDLLARLSAAHLITVETSSKASLGSCSSLVVSGGPWPLVSSIIDPVAIFISLRDTQHRDIAEKYLSRRS
jgi:origin recognition complex subunit 1